MIGLDSYSIHDLIGKAVSLELIEGVLRADGWIYLYMDGQVLTFTEGHARVFLCGLLGIAIGRTFEKGQWRPSWHAEDHPDRKRRRIDLVA